MWWCHCDRSTNGRWKIIVYFQTMESSKSWRVMGWKQWFIYWNILSNVLHLLQYSWKVFQIRISRSYELLQTWKQNLWCCVCWAWKRKQWQYHKVEICLLDYECNWTRSFIQSNHYSFIVDTSRRSFTCDHFNVRSFYICSPVGHNSIILYHGCFLVVLQARVRYLLVNLGRIRHRYDGLWRQVICWFNSNNCSMIFLLK